MSEKMEEFEKWLMQSQFGKDCSTHRAWVCGKDSESYSHGSTALAWEAWQAAQSAQAVASGKMAELLKRECEHTWKSDKPTQEEIEAVLKEAGVL